MNTLFEPLLELQQYQHMLENIRNHNTPILASGMIDVQQTHMIAGICHHLQRPAVILTYSELRARQIYENLSFFRKDTFFYPAKDLLFYSADVHSQTITCQRFSILNRYITGQQTILVLSIEALLDKMPTKETFSSFILELKEGDIVDSKNLLEQLLLMGYERTELVESVGQFAIRGGIIDIHSPIAEQTFRIELWDDEIDSIRLVNTNTQRSTQKIKSISIFPMRELVFDKELAKTAVQKIEKEYQTTLQKFEKNGFTDSAQRLKETTEQIIYALKNGQIHNNINNYINYFYENTVSLLSYIPKDTLLFFEEPDKIQQHMDTIFTEYSESMKERIEKGYILPTQGNILFDYIHILKEASHFSEILITTISQKAPYFSVKNTFFFSVKSAPAFQKRIDLFCNEITMLKKLNYRIIILAGGHTRCERMVKELQERDIIAFFCETLQNAPSLSKGSIMIASGRLTQGFSYQDIGFAVFSDKEFFGEVKAKKRRKKEKKGAVIESFTDLKLGDYVVHDNHGIGIFQGLEKIIVDGINKDYMKISYANGGNLFVPVNQMNLIQKYIGSHGVAPKLNKLGGQEWGKAKTKARSAIKILAQDLVALYAKRADAKGFVYSKDTLWQKEFEEGFPFEETEDQLDAIEDVKRDMENGKVMDRLICGDVGYGKTEVAIRAAFKAIQDSKQVAYLVPTTILAQQHYNTFLQRMSGYPIKIGLLSRFRTPKQQKETLEGLKNGIIDIVIGTHRILSNDICFKDLGLIIIDEEQRFGVGHKEKLKSFHENVNVLTLTATPIPRTLHMSLSGIRDMSILEEPPQERYPIQTYVLESNPAFVKEAIHRELARGGQVYYLFNRVQNIAEETLRLQKLVPEAKISYAHGQMTERELENIMSEFIEGQIDVLVCTTIIETGLDISNTNTIIIQDADRMGLSQLYQLRGRVGRSNRMAYAYLMYHRDKVLQETAEKRLQTIREFTEFGSGFKIAMRDLEIRGAGNLLGAEQHGHMEAIGYDMYCRLLESEIQNMKGEPKQEYFETTVDLNINAYIPDFYIKNQQQRMEMYKKIAVISNQSDYYNIQEELEDRYGNLPKSVQSLLDVVLLKAYAHDLGVLSIAQKSNSILLQLKADANIEPELITSLIANGKGKYLFTAGASPYITILMKKEEKESTILSNIKILLQSLKC